MSAPAGKVGERAGTTAAYMGRCFIMVARLRALASLLMLIGFFVFAFVLLILSLIVGFWAASHAHAAIKLVLVAVLGFGGAIVVGAKRALFFTPEEPDGILVSEGQAPQLWAEVRNLARVAGTRAPDDIRIVPEVNAAVSEDSKLLGLIPGRRHLYIGMPLLLGLNVSQFRAVIGHELGHYSNHHTRLGAIAFRGRLAIGGALDHLGDSLLSLPFRGYGRLYLLVDNAASRQQEREADQIAVKVAGSDAAATALAELPVLDAAWGFYFSRYVGPGADAGYLPRDLFRGFYELLNARQAELADLRVHPPSEKKSRWATHPPIGERVQLIRKLPYVALMQDTRMSASLIPMLDKLGEALQDAVVKVGNRRVTSDWSEITNAAAMAQLQEACDYAFRQFGRALNTREVNLGTILYAVEAGRAGELAAALSPGASREEAAENFRSALDALITLAGIRSGRTRYAHSWANAAKLVGASGEVDYAHVASLASDPATLPQARAELMRAGIALDQAQVVNAVATAKKSEVIGGIGNTKVDKIDHDMLILENGLILIVGGGSSEHGNDRMIAALRSAPVHELARRNRFLPFEEIASVEIEKQVPLRATLTLHDGSRMDLKEGWTSDLLAKDSRDLLLQIFRDINATVATN
jgi:Zn-dependent protease with chaperone function